MADNTQLNAATSTGDTIASDDIGGVKWQRVKLTLGADGVNDGDVSSTNKLPITGTVAVTGTVVSQATAANLRTLSTVSGIVRTTATGKQTVSGTVNAVLVSGGATFGVSGNPVHVDVVSTSVTVAQGTAANLKALVNVSGNVTVVQSTAANLRTLSTVSGIVKVQATGKVTVSGTVKSALVSGGATFGTSGNPLHIDIVTNTAGGAGGTSQTDAAAFTTGTTALTPAGGLFKDSAAILTSGKVGAFRMTAYRGLHTYIVTASGGRVGGTVNPMHVQTTGKITISGTAKAVMVSGGATFGVSGNPLHVDVVAGAYSGLTDSAAFTLASGKLIGVAGYYGDAAAALTSGKIGIPRMTAYRGLHMSLRGATGGLFGVSGNPLSVDDAGGALTVSGTVKSALVSGGATFGTSGNPVHVDIVTNTAGGAGGTSQTDAAAFTSGTTAATPIAGFALLAPSVLTSGKVGMARVTHYRALHVHLRGATGGVFGEADRPLHATVTGKTTVSGTVTVQQSTHDNLRVNATISGIPHVMVTGKATVSGTVTVQQATAANLKATVLVSGKPTVLVSGIAHTMVTGKVTVSGSTIQVGFKIPTTASGTGASSRGPISIGVTGTTTTKTLISGVDSYAIHVTNLSASTTTGGVATTLIITGATGVTNGDDRITFSLACGGGGFVLPLNPHWRIPVAASLKAYLTIASKTNVNVNYYMAA